MVIPVQLTDRTKDRDLRDKHVPSFAIRRCHVAFGSKAILQRNDSPPPKSWPQNCKYPPLRQTSPYTRRTNQSTLYTKVTAMAQPEPRPSHYLLHCYTCALASQTNYEFPQECWSCFVQIPWLGSQVIASHSSQQAKGRMRLKQPHHIPPVMELLLQIELHHERLLARLRLRNTNDKVLVQR